MSDPLRSIRQLVWLYFWLLLTEGALRKWIVPGLSTALLIVRDPVVLAIYAMAVSRGIFPRSALVAATAALAVCCAAASMAGIGSLSVTLYGLRADFLHLPLIVLLPHILLPSDVRRMGRALLFTLPAMALLAMLQFKGGPDSHWNVGAGGQLGGQLFASEGKVRVSGTFSFATGMTSYLALCSAFLLSDLLARRSYPRWLVFAGGLSLVFTLAISGSRSAVVTVTVVCSMMLYIAWRNPAQFGSVLRPLVFIAVVVAALAVTTTSFSEGIALQQDRFASAGGVKKGIIGRYFEIMKGGWNALTYSPTLGYGLGVGTNVGASLLVGQRGFVLGESEWQRVILESGPLLGLAYIALRAALLLVVLLAAQRASQRGRILPLLLVGAGGVDLIMGMFGQPTTLGFAVFIAGLALAAAGEDEAAVASEQVAPVQAAPALRGRSAYAQRLHGGPPE